MIKILKASAGSGKTYNLAETYIRLLLTDSDPLAYRHILAVTFTNKATDEMKGRILKELHLLSTDPGRSPYTKDFVPAVFKSTDRLKEKAGDILLRILHDYSAFAVSTIDRFFQQTLKAFSREIGQFASYQVELDKESLISESVDRVLDSLTEDDKALLGWLSDNMLEQLEQDQKFNLEGSLSKTASRLKSEEHRAVVEGHGIDEEKVYSKENLSRMRAMLRKVKTGFEARLKEAAGDVGKAFAECGISPSDTSRGFMGTALSKLMAMDERSGVPELSASFLSKAVDYGSWFRKADQSKYSSFEYTLAPPAARLAAIYKDGIKAYNTAKLLSRQIGSLGIASELFKEFQKLLKEKNVLSIDDSNVILKDIIDGSDAPFIYEKLGVRFEHFLLDEFQDTSRVQWENFKPLIANSDSEGFENLLVGDVKQSIYRWRGSDWSLMAREVSEEFPDAEEESLKGNWRSLRNIVGFNNEFFPYAAGRLDSMHGLEGAEISVSSIYGKRDDGGFEYQEVRTKDDAEGLVEAIFCDSDEENRFILETVRKVLDAGAIPGDITVLVRNNLEGAEVAAFLMENGMEVISDDSLRLKSSYVVRKLVSLISSVKNPDDTIRSYLAHGSDAGEVSFHSLPDLCEQLLRTMKEGGDGEALEEETLYVQSFMDFVQDHVALNGNSLDIFLKAWEDADPKVSSPSDTGAIRVMTIHKSKGLEFPYVIFPYSEKVGLFRSGKSWTVPEVGGTLLDGLGKAAFDIELSSKSSSTLFEEDYRKELLLQYIDNINTFYVALTRASKGLTIISDIGSSANKNFAGILLEYQENFGEDKGFSVERDEAERIAIFRKGGMYDFAKMERKESGVSVRVTGFPSFPLNPQSEDEVTERGRLKVSSESADFFTEEGAAVAKARHNGTVLHDILSRVRVPSDLEISVDQAVRAGDLEAGRKEEVTALLKERIAAHPEWFPTDGAEIFNETSLIDTDGCEWRPDRVVIRNGVVTVIDYKFGERDRRYRAQVSKYAGIYRRLGYKDVSTAIWYVASDEVE